jgi:hypothetical protein
MKSEIWAIPVFMYTFRPNYEFALMEMSPKEMLMVMTTDDEVYKKDEPMAWWQTLKLLIPCSSLGLL